MITEPHLAQALDKNGFCTLPLLGLQKVSLLQNLYKNFSAQMDADGVSTAGPEVNKTISTQALAIVKEELKAHFAGDQYYAAHFVNSKAGDLYGKALHQNWNITDEQLNNSYQVLIPLDTFYPEAGGPFLVPGSHRFFKNHRSGSFGVPIVSTNAISEKLRQDITLLAGDGLVYHNAMFHGCYANKTVRDSVALIIYLLDENAEPAYFHKELFGQVCTQYTITADLLFVNLETLSRAKVPEFFTFKSERPLHEMENQAIDSGVLNAAFTKYWGKDTVASEIKMLHITRDKPLEEKLDKQGYAIIPFASPEQIAALRDYFFKQFGGENFEPGMLITINQMTYQRKREMHEFFLATLKPSFEKFFKDYVTPVSSYFTKNPSTLNSYLPMHTDSNLVLNPHLEPHYALWIPLQDVDENNGAVTVVRNSQRFPAYIAAPTIPWPFKDREDFLNKEMKVISLKAGEVILFDNRLIHCSRPNVTGEIRIGISIRLTHYLTPYFSFYLADPKSNMVEVYSEPQNFYLAQNWRNSDKPSLTGHKAGEILISPYSHSLAELQEIIEA